MTFPTQVVILGAGGFIGQALFRLANSRSIDTLCVSRSFQWLKDMPALPGSNIFIEEEISNINAYKSLVNDEALIVYMAGSTNLEASEADPVNDFKVHCMSLLSIFELIKKSHKFIFLSSAGTIYGEPVDRQSKESDDLSPKSIYGHRNKILEEIISAVSLRLGFHCLIMRIANPFGPEQLNLRRKGLILSLLDSHDSGRTVVIRGDGEQRRDYILVDDLCELILGIACLSTPLCFDILNVASGFSYSARDVVSIVTSSLGVLPKVEYVLNHNALDIIDSSIDVSLLRDLLESIGKEHLFKDLPQTIGTINQKH